MTDDDKRALESLTRAFILAAMRVAPDLFPTVVITTAQTAMIMTADNPENALFALKTECERLAGNAVALAVNGASIH